jgi:hypothetical protein
MNGARLSIILTNMTQKMCICARCKNLWVTQIAYPERCERCKSPNWYEAWPGEYLEFWPICDYDDTRTQVVFELKNSFVTVRTESSTASVAFLALHKTLPKIKAVIFPGHAK